MTTDNDEIDDLMMMMMHIDDIRNGEGGAAMNQPMKGIEGYELQKRLYFDTKTLVCYPQRWHCLIFHCFPCNNLTLWNQGRQCHCFVLMIYS